MKAQFNKKILFYLSYLLLLLLFFILERSHIFIFSTLVTIIAWILPLVFLFNRIPFLNHSFSSIKDQEQQIEDIQPLLSLKLFLLLMLPLVIYLLLL